MPRKKTLKTISQVEATEEEKAVAREEAGVLENGEIVKIHIPLNKDVLMTIPSTGEKVVYSEAVHGKDYREIAQNTANKFGGVITEIE